MHILWLFRSLMFYGTSITLKISFWNWKERKWQNMGLHDLCVVLSMTLGTLNNSFLLPRLWESIVKANDCSCFYRSSNHLAAQTARKHVRRSYFQVIFWSRLFILFNIQWSVEQLCFTVTKTFFGQNCIGSKPNVLYLKNTMYVFVCVSISVFNDSAYVFFLYLPSP